MKANVPVTIQNIALPNKQLLGQIIHEEPVVLPIDDKDAFLEIWKQRKIDAESYHNSEPLARKATAIIDFIAAAGTSSIMIYLWTQSHILVLYCGEKELAHIVETGPWNA
ncbi:MAG: hypothetical protein K8T91_26935 [Planctomycetes bacterium]|nr:hypothetical protein [Planctomycetota bacterium]